MEDAATARQLMQDELLQIEREKLCRVIQDEASVISVQFQVLVLLLVRKQFVDVVKSV